jgi:hypothetical protein
MPFDHELNTDCLQQITKQNIQEQAEQSSTVGRVIGCSFTMRGIPINA